jgi:putative (di)nucleoside polyphosphate hydrolase
MTPASPSLPYRQGVGLMLFNRAGHVWVGRRIDQLAVGWQMPQGGIDAGETPAEAALRELAEETGTDKAEIIAESSAWLSYELPPELLGIAWHGRYRGQQQKWFALAFLGRDADFDINTSHAEFADWRWLAFDQLVPLVVPFKRALYQSVTAEFADLAARLRDQA